ncbi:hypothetical protein GCM10009554_45360 [Kribbella koreensis]|uniref:Uncharacterized protein n=1 Tax=Kribbella koreensis TaxID=57909 RepID=A0ABP4BB83_9ACTN
MPVVEGSSPFEPGPGGVHSYMRCQLWPSRLLDRQHKIDGLVVLTEVRRYAARDWFERAQHKFHPVWPSIDSLIRSAWPLWRAYSSIM